MMLFYRLGGRRVGRNPLFSYAILSNNAMTPGLSGRLGRP
jgi:hypothetical protein